MKKTVYYFKLALQGKVAYGLVGDNREYQDYNNKLIMCLDKAKLSTNPHYSPLVRVVHIQRHRAHLDSVSIISRILKQTVIWIEHLTRQKEKELPRWSAIIQTETAIESICYDKNLE